MKVAFYVTGILLFSLVVMSSIVMITSGPGRNNVLSSRRSLSEVRKVVQHYHDIYGEFPKTLDDAIAARFHEHNTPANKRAVDMGWLFRDRITGSIATGTNVSIVLDGNSGWYYDAETGSVRLNTCVRLWKLGLQYLFSPYALEIPSTW